MSSGLNCAEYEYFDSSYHSGVIFTPNDVVCMPHEVTEQCSYDRSLGAKMIPRQPVVEDVTLAARPLRPFIHLSIH